MHFQCGRHCSCECSRWLVLAGIHPTTISDSFQKAAAKSAEVLEGMSTVVELTDRESLLQSATTALNSKVSDTTTTILRLFFRDHPGEPVPEENFWTLWCTGKLTEADTQTTRLGTAPSPLTSAHLHHSPIFYRPDALPAAQPTVSKH